MNGRFSKSIYDTQMTGRDPRGQNVTRGGNAGHRIAFPVQAGRSGSRQTWAAPHSRATKPSSERRKIYFYHRQDPYYGFTNFSPHKVVYEGKVYPTSEHLFQSFKFSDDKPLLAEHIRRFSDQPSVALSEARRFQPEARKDWFLVNIQKMEQALRLKFDQHPDLKQQLLGTGDAELIEASDRDSFWGTGASGKGRNELGKALMRLRTALRKEYF